MFGNKPKKEEEQVAEEEELATCNNCGKDFKEEELSEDWLCAECEKKEEEKKEISKAYTYSIEIKCTSEYEDDNEEFSKISKEDAEKCFLAIKDAIDTGKEFAEIPEMQSLDDDGNKITLYKQLINIKEKILKIKLDRTETEEE